MKKFNKMTYKKQVKEGHYAFRKYLPLERWISYYHQIKNIMSVRDLVGKKIIKVLIIGVGDSVVPLVLKNFGLFIKTLDFDKTLKPDYFQALPDIKLREKFDCILCSQVLEHIKFDDVRKSIKYFSKMCKYLVISIPNRNISLSFSFKPWFFAATKLVLSLKNPFSYKGKAHGQHYWEIGDGIHTADLFMKMVNSYGFITQTNYRVAELPYHHFFVFKSIHEK